MREGQAKGKGEGKEEGRTIVFLVLLVLPHGHEAGAGGEDFVPDTALVIGLLRAALVIVDLLLGLLGVVLGRVSWGLHNVRGDKEIGEGGD